MADTASGQVAIGAGTYAQNFDALASSGTLPWTNNLTLPGWYAAKGSADVTNYSASAGTSTSGALYSFGTNGAHATTERALGSVASGSANPVSFGIRFTNNTAQTATNITVSYTGEQWRNGGNTNAQPVLFSYAVSGTAITNSFAAANWTNFSALNFSTPTVLTNATALDGNAATNRQVFTNIILTGVVVLPGQELFLRWTDADAPGFDDGLAVDDFTVSFGAITPPANTPPVVTTPPQSQTVNAGDTVSFSVAVNGTAPFSYQWKSNSVAIPGATSDTFTLFNVPTNLNGSVYFVTVTNVVGATNSANATLTVEPAPGVFTYMTYNLHGNGATNWTTNTAQAQAIGRQIAYLNPDLITFNEIPHAYTNEMTNWITAFMPGYSLAVSPGTDGYINSGIASRYPIARSQKWLDGVSLSAFGYNGNFARDMFEAEIVVPGFAQHIHAFVVHLKATTSGGQADADKRAAEASCVSNFFVNTFLVGTNKLHPYILSGDMNEDIYRPAATNVYISGQPIQRLVSAPTGLRFTTPTNRYDLSTSNDMTISIQDPLLSARFDYILPCTLLFSNITGSQVFRTDKLPVLPPNLFSNDDKVASDHLPVVMTFANPFTQPFSLTSLTRSQPAVTLQWGAVPGGIYRVENSTNLTAWTTLATNLVATNYFFSFTTNNVTDKVKFFRVRTQ